MKQILKLEKRGCEFCKNSIESTASDLENYRLFGLLDINLITNEYFKNKKATDCCIEIRTHYFDKKDQREDFKNKTKTYIEISYKTGDGNWHIPRDCYQYTNEPTQESVLETINKFFGTNYKKLKFVETNYYQL